MKPTTISTSGPIGFWAKTAGNGVDYLPVEAHLLDAGHVALRLFDESLTARQQAWIAGELGVDVKRARAIVAFTVAAHDIGKVSPFQRLAPDLAARLGSRGAELPDFVDGPHRHDEVSGWVLYQFVQSRGGSRDLADGLTAAVCGHHSVPRDVAPRRNCERPDLRAWGPYHEQLLDRLCFAFALDSFADVRAPSHAVVTVLAGLVNVSDWNASDAARFPVTAGDRASSAKLTSSALRTEAWRPLSVTSGDSFEDVFGFSPRSMQAAAIDLLDHVALPALVVIEDRTGSGKTEAALWIARRALQEYARGLYIGLPTRATANQAHSRTRDFFERLWPDADAGVRLLHGEAHLALQDNAAPSQVGEGQANDTELALARGWFDAPRRGLLSPYAVGTIDQALLAGLRTRFYPVRLWGLAGKVVVVDEVHAYDVYTGTLLDSLLRWLGALRCTVVLLSATLPARRRECLAAAYRDGIGGTDAASRLPDPLSAGYPRITAVSESADRTIAVTDDRPGRAVAIRSAACVDDAGAVARLALDEVSDGGCAAVVCSTVALAQERYRVLGELDSELEVVLLHARIRPCERQLVENAITASLGPATDSRPAQLVVVATQVIEQSLDIDFDVMLTDLAPVDLLVQRAGRVHRHARVRPRRHMAPRLILLDTGGEAVDRGLPHGAGAVYVDAVLARTRAALRGRSVISEPDDLDDLIETVYGCALPAGLGQQARIAIASLDDEARRKACEHAQWAKENSIGSPVQEDPPWLETPSALADEDVPGAGPKFAAVTRWSERPTCAVVVLTEDEARLVAEPLTKDTARRLLSRSVGISDRRVTERVLAEPEAFQPGAWRSHGALSHHALSVVGASDGLALDYDPVLGVLL